MLSSFASKIYDYCVERDFLSGVSSLIVGLSGGPDSVALILALDEIKRSLHSFPSIYAVHINHNLRSTAKDDENLAINLCLKLEIPCTTYEFDVRKEAKDMGRGLEEAGRILRYMAFNERLKDVALQNGVDEDSVRIVTAHHKGDLAETFMMNLFRGSGIEGLVSFGDSNNILRPLLCVGKEEILNYLKDLGESYAIDETNFDSKYTRNKWRNEILPLISTVSNKNPEEAIFRTNSLLSSDADYLKLVSNSEYQKAVKRINGRVFLSIEGIKQLHIAIKSRVIRILWEETFGNLTDFESIHVDSVLDLIKDSKGSRYLSLAFGRIALSTDKYIGFCTKDEECHLACAMASCMGFVACALDEPIYILLDNLRNGKITKILPNTDIVISADIVENTPLKVYNTCSWFCKPKDLVIQKIELNKDFVRAGDTKAINIMKTLSDLKVPRSARANLITICSGDRILWVPGLGHTEGFLSPKSYEAWYNDGNQSVDKLIRITIAHKGVNDG